MSDSMSPPERNYEIYDKELLAIVCALKKWRKQLLSTDEDFEVWTDHKNLQYFQKPQNISRRVARWIGDLAEYHFTLHHMEGTKNKVADALSRRPDHDDGSTDNQNIAVLPKHLFRTVYNEQPIMDQIKEGMNKDRSWARLKKKYQGE